MEPPPATAIDMRHTKLKASEAALLAGELVKPTWASRNEGIHERVSFEDTLWGFEMAGGAFYKTPLRVAYVRPGSRAEHACIRMGDTVLRINGQDTSNLTLQEAHKLVLDAGINLKIVVTSPEDKVNAHYDYEDPLLDTSGPTPEELREMERERVRKALERAARCRELPWPWVRRKWVIYRESNCFMVPSKYENKHRDKFPELPAERLDYFFPAEKKKSIQENKSVEESKPIKENNINDNEEEEEEYEEVEEEVEEEEVAEEETSKTDNNVTNNSIIERLEEQSSELANPEKPIHPSIEQEESTPGQVNVESSQLETETEQIDKEISEELDPKDSNQDSELNYKLDNNNHHVVKPKDDSTIEESQDNSVEIIINEIAENSTDVEENKTRNDDDILESILNGDTDADLENER